MKSILGPAFILLAALTLVCGVLYPLAITGIGQILFADKAAGSLVSHEGKLAGSTLIGQAFSSPGYFWGRPSTTSPMPNNAASSGGSNFGPTNLAQIDAIKTRIEALRIIDSGNTTRLPVDLVTASASGLDPEISLAAACYQAERIARAHKLTIEEVRGMIDKHSEPQYFGFFGEPRVNVLALNLALDRHP